MARKLAVGDVLSKTFSTWFANIAAYVALFAVVTSPVLVLQLVFPVDPNNPNEVFEKLPQTILVNVVLQSILTAVASAAVVYGVFQHLRGQTVDMSECITIACSSSRRAPSLSWP